MRYVLLLSIFFQSLASHGKDNFHHLSMKDGLSSNITYQAVEDKEGFIWVTTDEGVDRFDGRTFVHYELELHNEIRSQGYLFYRILIDNQDHVVIVSNKSHVFLLDRDSDRFKRLSALESNYGKYVFSAILDANQHLLMGTPNGLIVFDYAHQQFVSSSFTKSVYAIQKTPLGIVLGVNEGMVMLSKDYKSSQFMGQWDTSIGQEVRLKSLSYDGRNERIWFGTQRSGLNYYDVKSKSYHKSGLKTNKHVLNFPVWDIEMANDSTMLVGTDGSGIAVVDLNTMKIIRTHITNDQEEHAISSNVIHDILICRNTMYFIATNMGGINLLYPLQPEFEAIRKNLFNENSLKNNVVHAIVEVKPGSIAFGTDQGVSLWENGDMWTEIGRKPEDGQNNVVTSMTKGSDESLWVGYFLGLAERLSLVGKQYVLPEEIEKSKNSKAMYFDEAHNTFWVGHEGQSNRLLSYNFDSKTIHSFSVKEVSAIADHPSGKLLVGTYAGLYIIDKSSNEYQVYKGLDGSLQRVTTLSVDTQGNVWVGSKGGGIAKISWISDQTTIFNEQNGLASNKIYALIEDRVGKIWVANAAGISRIDPSTGDIINYSISDGIISDDFMYNAICLTTEGKILVGSTAGVTLFDPETLIAPIVGDHLVFTDLTINEKKIVVDESTILHQRLNRTNEIELAHDQNSIALTFTNIDLIHPEQVRFTWKLDGYDPHWSENPEARTAIYSNLPPGEYTFRLRNQALSNSLAQIGERSILFRIAQPIWKTTWAYVLYTLVIVGGMLFVLYYNKLMHDVQSSKDRLRYLVDMAHAIKTPLSLIKAPIGDLLQNSTDQSEREKLTTAMDNVDKLQKKMGQFLDFKRVDQIVNVHLESLDMVGLIQSKIFAFSLLAERMNVKLHFETSMTNCTIQSDPELLDKIINNLVSNAIKYNKSGGFVNIRLIKAQGKINMTVTDSGIGIPKKEQKKIFKLFFRATTAIDSKQMGSGVGLSLSKDMVSLMGGSLSFESRLDEGTTFALTLPVGSPSEIIPEVQQEQIGTDTKITKGVDVGLFKVMVVDDDDDLRGYVAQQMRQHYQVIEANNGQDALKMLKKDLPDLVLSDITMPQMNGRQLCMNIKSETATSHIPVVLLSGLDAKDDVLKGLEAGADDYISKPFDLSILMAKIENLITNRKELKEKIINADIAIASVDFKNEHDKEFVKQITTLVEENISDSDFSVRILFSAVGMSRTSFYHKLKSLIDLSPAEFIRIIRLNKAKELIQQEEYNINEVAYRCGFSDAKYFSTSFKKQFGKSPSQFTKK